MVVRPPFTAGKGELMKKSARISDIFLRVLLSLALVVSFVPIARDASYAAEEGDASPDAVSADVSNGDGDLASEGDAGSANGEADAAADASGEGESPAESGSSGNADSASGSARLGSDATLSGDSNAADGESAGSAQAFGVYEYGKLMPNGSVYKCDKSGNLAEPIDESDPKLHSVDPGKVKNLIVDFETTSVPKRLCFCSTYLQSVRFENTVIKSIGEYAFYGCSNFSSISLSGMQIGSIDEGAFSSCLKLTSLNIEETTTIQELGSSCFRFSGLVTTDLDHVEGLKTIPDGAYDECYDLVDTGLAGNQSIETIGADAFSYCYSLVDTGLGANTHVTSIGEYAFVGCEKLRQTGLGTNARIASVGDHAFSNCASLRLSGLETNATISKLGKNCFEGTDMSGGLVLPRDSKITELPKKAFYKTSLDFVYFQCDHAVSVGEQTFPSSLKSALIPSRSLALYQGGDAANSWVANGFALPVDASEYLSIHVTQDPDKMTYWVGSEVSLDGMKVDFAYDGTQRTFDYADLASNYAFSQFFSVDPKAGTRFQSSNDGTPMQVTYNDGDNLLNAYSSGVLQNEGNGKFFVCVESPTAQDGETATGGGQFVSGDKCTVSAETTVDGRLFAYWADGKGNVLSESKSYTFDVTRSIVLVAVFADAVTVAPEARFGNDFGPIIEGVEFSIVANGVPQGGEYVTYPGKTVTVSCSYDASELTFEHWGSEKRGFITAEKEVEYQVQAKDTLYAEFAQPDPGEPIDPVVAVHVNYSQTIDMGGRTLMEGVEVPNVSGSRFLFAGQLVALDAERLGMFDDDIGFVGWYDKETGELVSDKRVCLFKPEVDTNVEARFALKDVAVRINPAQSTDLSEAYAHVMPTVGNCYRDAGETVALSATTDNAQFRGWYEGPSGEQTLISSDLACNYEVPNVNGQATRVEITPWYCARQASVVLDVDGTTEDGSPQGSFIATGLYGIGSSVTVVAIPAPYYALDYVTDAAGNKVNLAENGTYTFTLTGDTQLTAHFRAVSDGKEAFEILQAALITALGVAIIAATASGIGELVDPIAVPAIVEVGEAETIEDLVEVGGKALKEIEEIFEHHKHDRDPDKPKGDHKATVIATAQPEVGGIVKGGGVHLEGTVAELDAIPNPGYRFVCWKEDGVERSTLPHLQMAITDVTPDIVKLTAVFEKDATITTSINVEGAAADAVTGCNATPDRQVVKTGTEATVIAVAGEGYEFAGWYDGVAEVSKTPTYTFFAETDRHLVAKFQRTCKVTVTVEPASALAGKCTITGDGTCVVGKPTVLSARLDESVREKYTFKGWYRAGAAGDVLMGTDEAHLEFIPEGDTVIRAEYVAKKYTIKVEIDGLITSINPPGEVSIVGEPGKDWVELPYGRHVTIKAKADDKHWFAYWQDNSGKRYTDAELRVCVTKDETYTAVFKKGPEVVIAADSWWGGTVTCNGTEVKPDTDQFKLGETLHLKAENNPGWLFWGWYENGLLVSTEKECTLVAESTKLNSYYCTITAAFKPLDVVCLPVASPAEGGSVTASRILADRGADVALKATPAPGYAFVGWYTLEGELVSTEPEFTDREARSHVYVAHFKECSYTVAATAAELVPPGELVENADAGWVEGTGTYGANYPATLSAHASEGYTFKYWVDGAGAPVSTNAEYRFVPNENTSLRAVFEAKRFTVNVTAAEGYGTVSGAGTYAAGQTATVAATPAENATFIGWYSEGVCVSTSAEYRFTVRGDTDLTAVFGAGACTVSTVASPVEAGYTSGFGSFAAGDRTTLSAVAKPGFTFDCWKDARGNVVSALPECTVAVTSSAAYVACFTRDSYYVELSANQEGAGVLTGGGTYSFGDTVELNAQQATDKRFVSWQLVGEGGEKTLLSTDAHCWLALDEEFISSLDDNVVAIEAQFADPYEVSVSAKAVVMGKTGARGCKVKGSGTFKSGDKVTLRAVAGEGYRFVGWSTDEVGYFIVDRYDVFSFEASSDVTYYAQFEPDPAGKVEVAVTQSSIFRGLAFIAGASGAGTSLSCDKGDAFVAMAVAYPGMRFSHWIDDAGAIVSYNAIHAGIAHENMRLTAVFYATGFDAQVATYPEGAGFSMVIPGTSASYMGASVMITIPYPGWKFDRWVDENGATVGKSPLLVRPAYANRTFTAYYVRDVVEVVAIDPREGGHLEGSASYGDDGYAVQKTVEAGESVTLVAVPDDGYDFAGWYACDDEGTGKDAEPLSADASWTFAPTTDTKVIARFAEKPKLRVSATAENGTVEPSSVEVAPGGDAAFVATPDGGCYLDHASATETAAEDETAPSHNFNISDYAGGSYTLILKNVAASQELSFAFAKAGAPVVTMQPQSATVYKDDSAMLSVAADAAFDVLAHEDESTGAAASHELAYQWYRIGADGKGAAIEGATLSSLSIAKASEGDAGAYYCRVTQKYLGTETSVDTETATISLAQPEELVFNATELPLATAWSGYSADIAPATGGVAPYTYTLTEGSSLPKGVAIKEPSGSSVSLSVAGEPQETGAFGFDIVCTDGAGATKTAHFTLIVKPQVAKLSFSKPYRVYNGEPQMPTLSGIPEGLEGVVAYVYTGTGDTRYSGSVPPVDAGTYRVVATLRSNGYVGRATADYRIIERPAYISLAAEDATYDGEPHGATVSVPSLESSDYTVNYTGVEGTEYGPTSAAPRDAGTYEVAVCVTNPNYQGRKSEEFTISPALQEITGTTDYAATYGDAGFAFDNTAKTPVTFEVVPSSEGAPDPISVQGSYASIEAAGAARVVAHAAASRNYLAASDVELTVTVSPAKMLVIVHDAERVEGEANPKFSSDLISPADTSGVSVKYSCEANEASPAGEYAIDATVSDPNFSAIVEPGTLTVTAKPTPDPGPTPDPDPDPDPTPDPGPSPVDPDDPDHPTPTPDPDNPDNPDGPDNPDQPDNPDDPDDPSDPDSPDSPDDPGQPDDPDNPDSPDTPDNPDGPSDPSNPDNPSDPGNPSGPSGPVNPDNGKGDFDGPVNPGDSGNSNDPSKSGGQTGDAASGSAATLEEKAGSNASGDSKRDGQTSDSSSSSEPSATSPSDVDVQGSSNRSDTSADAKQASNRIIPVVAGAAIAVAVLGGTAAASVAFVRRRKIPK